MFQAIKERPKNLQFKCGYLERCSNQIARYNMMISFSTHDSNIIVVTMLMNIKTNFETIRWSSYKEGSFGTLLNNPCHNWPIFPPPQLWFWWNIVNRVQRKSSDGKVNHPSDIPASSGLIQSFHGIRVKVLDSTPKGGGICFCLCSHCCLTMPT